MTFDKISEKMIQIEGVEKSTMMGSQCLRYKGEFISMMFNKANALIIKVSPKRVNELIDLNEGLEFNFTKKKFKEWVLIPKEFENMYEEYVLEALEYGKNS
ncbi:MAG: hypothetical protein NE328_11160 [Lentisphaeraceae bacterium]|nr:hypothetical protein [Lentisphaeraceae bacterium]